MDIENQLDEDDGTTRGDDDTAPEITYTEHIITPQEVAQRYTTSLASGLTSDQVKLRRAKIGANVLSPPPVKPWYLKLLAHFTDFFSLLLQFAALLCFVAYFLDPAEKINLYLGIVLYFVVVATSLFAFLQQHKSDQTLREFRNFLPPQATVRRDGGQTSIIPAADLVPGDIVMVKLGDKVPADLRIVYNSRLKVDNSALTGESEACERGVTMTSQEPLETQNLAFLGTLAVDGSATGIVIGTGDRTVFGQIAKLTNTAKDDAELTTLQMEIHHFVVVIAILAMGIGITFFIIGAIKGTELLVNIVNSIGIIVSNVPEGLIATVTVSLTASSRRMARKNVLVKRLEAIETLGSTTVICSDKTGTLTQNRMTVSHIAYATKIEVMRPGWTPPVFAQEFETAEDRAMVDCVQSLLNGGMLCSAAVFDAKDMSLHPEKDVTERKVSGDASEAGILRFCESITSVKEARTECPLIASIPFNSANKYMVTVHRIHVDSSRTFLRLHMKGAPERVLERCSYIKSDARGIRQIESADRESVFKQVEYLATKGERVLAFAELELSPQEAARVERNGEDVDFDDIPTQNLCFIGLVSLLDPPRESVPYAIGVCKDAGIRVIMVTGDHEATARAIALQVGILVDDSSESRDIESDDTSRSIVVKGTDLAQFSELDWNRVLAHDHIVFARTSPQQKLHIVENLQRLGEIVSVTGDGANDAPALKRANTGIAMGISGSEVSKEAADLVLLDDNFSSIVSGVEEGRLIFDNLKKSIAYTLTSNVPQLLPFIAFVFLQLPLPLTTVLILCIDLGTDIFPAISLAYENAESDLMKRKPRVIGTNRLLNRVLISFALLQLGIMQSFAGFYAYFVIMDDYGLPPKTLLGLDKQVFFASEEVQNQRWMFTVQDDERGVARDAQWFAPQNQQLKTYFTSERKGFVRQEAARYDRVLVGAPSNLSVSIPMANAPTNPQFNNMVKVLGTVTKRPPCLSYGCVLDGGVNPIRNSPDCFDANENKGSVFLTGIMNGDANPNIVRGQGNEEGCYSLWTVQEQRAVLEHAQTGFFVAVVISQVAALLTCKTRILSLFQRKIKNKAILLSLVLEFSIALALVYFPLLQFGFETRSLRFVHWLPALPFALFIIIYDEVRKLMIRSALRADQEHKETGKPFRRWDRFARWVRDYTMW
eukprot:Plantae.Rhodophyta-Hildenbrandia_rubra.ctg13534.p1 GENE.Plantae.Rhodophyta-Hildenbrandia_rubra.ctg13534~~Plantae.Rhodophyta-Hildenbrandia_rubra.ctg13534.p1  ORF type:complete len:1169 (+),score=203.15 Plantae.Rhodophyta-Hildenbrandia_rubra.ctg13534:522-4028(+)